MKIHLGLFTIKWFNKLCCHVFDDFVNFLKRQFLMGYMKENIFLRRYIIF